MKAAAAAHLVWKLLADENMALLQTHAAIALYRISGEKVKQFPKGYNAD